MRGESAPADERRARRAAVIRLAICDDDAMVRRLLTVTALEADDIEVVAVCSSGEEALLVQADVDVWLMDMRMPGMTGSEVCRRLRARNPAPQVLILTAFATEPLTAAYRAGACGYLFKDESPNQLLAAIRAAAAGFTVSSTRAMADLLDDYAEPAPILPASLNLSDLDEVIVKHLLTGASYAEIARRVHMSESGIKKRTSALMKQVGVKSRPQLMARLHEFVDTPGHGEAQGSASR